MTVMPRIAIAALCLGLLQACDGRPPDYTSDEDDARIYADVISEFREKRNASGTIYLHPYLAVARDEEGAPRVDLSRFEYEPSAALELLRQDDSSVVLCGVNAQGLCVGDYLVISQMARLSERDAVVIVQPIRGGADGGALMVKLRYGRGAWNISGSS